MDTNWCLICGRHTRGDVYCSQMCAQEDGAVDTETSWLDNIDTLSGAFAITSTESSTTSSMEASPSSSLSALAWTRNSVGVDPSILSVNLFAASQQHEAPHTMKSPPSHLLAEIRQRRLQRACRELPRRRGLPFHLEMQAERVSRKLTPRATIVLREISTSEATLVN